MSITYPLWQMARADTRYWIVLVEGRHDQTSAPAKPKDRRGFDLISEALPFGRLWYQDADAAVGYAKFYSRSQQAELRVMNESGAIIHVETWAGDFKEA
jgi:hypothetical protein